MAMSFLSYKVVRGTCLRFPEQLEVVVTGDVLQQRLPARPVALTVLLYVQSRKEETLSKYIYIYKYMGNEFAYV